MDERRQRAQSLSAGRLIAADVGGTHARIALIDVQDDGGFVIAHHRGYQGADFTDLGAIFGVFFGEIEAPPNAPVALAIAGYVLDDAIVNPNLPWPVSLAQLRAALGERELAIINDFVALAHAIGHIDAAKSTLLSGPETAPLAPALVVGPGTGLGAAVRIPHRGRSIVLATEAGHATLAASTELETAILAHLRSKLPRVMVEHVISGPGLSNVYTALRAMRGLAHAAPSPAQISASALARTDAIAIETVEVFFGWFGAVLGDFALSYGASGGIHLAGGVLPRLGSLLGQSTLVERFLDKGDYERVLARIPVRLADDPELGVIGAASWYLDRD